MSASHMKGFAELNAYLTALPDNMQRNAVSAGLRAAARVVRDEARRNAPRDSGATIKNIRIGSVRRDRGSQVYSISVRVTGKESYYAYFQEYGVARHVIMKKQRAANKIGDEFVSGVIDHPGHAPRPFMRPALDSQQDAVLLAMRDRIGDWLKGKTGFNPLEGDDE